MQPHVSRGVSLLAWRGLGEETSLQVAPPVETSALDTGDAEVVAVCRSCVHWERLLGSGYHIPDCEVAASTAWAWEATELEEALIRTMVVRESAAVLFRHGVCRRELCSKLSFKG